MKRRRWGVFATCLGVMFTFGRLVLASKLYGTAKEQAAWPHAAAFAALAYHGSPLYCVTVAALVLGVALRAGPVLSLLATLLASPPLRHFAKVCGRS